MHPGKVLNYIPDQLEIENEDDKACCVALECYSCAFLSDLTGLGAMQLIEPDDRKLNVQVFCKYIYSWPFFCSKWRDLSDLAGPTMEECRKTTHRWLVEWLPELSVVEVSVEFQYKHNTQEEDSLDEFSEHCLMVARCAKEGILKEICAESVKRKIANGGTVVRAPRRFGFFNANLDAHWVVNITTGSREAQEITNADKWENDFYKVFWTFVIHHEQSNQQAVGKA